MVLTHVCEGGKTLSAAVAETYAARLFEEDPFLDLEGTEAAQKLMILARELGVSMDISDVEVTPLCPFLISPHEY